MLRQNALPIIALFAALTASIPAATAQVAPQPADQAVTRVYDVRDLLRVARDYPYAGPMLPADNGGSRFGGGGGGGGGGLFSGGGGGGGPARGGMDQPPRQPLAVSAAAMPLAQLLIDTVSPESWRDNGGAVGEGAIRELSGQLVITQTPPNHELISDLLRQLRAPRQRLVRVTAHWLLLEPAAADALFRTAAPADANNASAETVVREVNLEALRQQAPDAVRYRGETICFDGQTVHLVSGRGRTVITNVDPVVGSNSVGYDLKSELRQTGAMLQFTATLSGGGPEAVLDVHSLVSEREPSTETGPATVAAPLLGSQPTTGPVTAPPVVMVDRVNAVTQELRTTLRVPLGRAVLVGGMTFEPTTEQPDAPQLYLVVELAASK